MNGWVTKPIAEIAEKIAMGPFGSNIKVSTFVDQGVPIISGQHLHGTRLDEASGFNFITDEHAEKLKNSNVFPGDIVFTHAGTIGQVSLIPDTASFRRYVISQRQFYLRVDKRQADPAFVTRWFHAPVGRHRLMMHASQVGVPSISRPASNLKEIQIDLPPLGEQQAISETLDIIDDKIELNRRMAATLEEMARALYRSWFVDFDPVKAKAEGLAPAFMDEATAALFPDRFGDNGLPEGWKKGVLGELIEFNPRETLKKGAEAPYLDMKALPTSGMISDAPYPRVFSSGTKFRSGDTLLARITPCLENGKTAMVDDLDGSAVGWGSTEFIVMRGRSGVPPAYPYCVARDADFRGEAIATMTGSSGRQRADADRISHLPCAVPPRPVIDAFGSQTGSIVKQVHAIGRQNRTLVALRDSLLPKLMSGELRVGEARDQIEEVA